VKTFTKSLDGTAQQRVGKDVKAALALIQEPLKSVEREIQAQARAFDPAVEGYIAYAVASSGKRLRPALALLAGHATGGVRDEHRKLAVIIELIHLATLVHDDIMDGAELRRGQQTANAKWGNAISVLLGDCLFAHALKLATTFESAEVSREIAIAATEVCSGEIIQTQRRFDLKLRESEYFRIIEMKTAALFSVSARLGGVLAGATPEMISALDEYGRKLGTAYQIYDDCLDLAGDESRAGKTLGSDIRKGKLTLPILRLLNEKANGHHPEICEMLLRGDEEDVGRLAAISMESGAMLEAVETARVMVREAIAGLDVLPANAGTAALRDVAACVIDMLDGFAD